MTTINTQYINKITGEHVTTVAMNEIVPNDLLLNHGIMPLVEYVDAQGDWHIMFVTDFQNTFI